MNLSEFKAWFEGFTENLDGPPGPKAWKRVQEKVAAIKPDPTPWPQFIKEYVPYYPTWPYYTRPYWTVGGSVGQPITWAVGMNSVGSSIGSAGQTTSNVTMDMVSTPLDAFRDVGRLDEQTYHVE